MCCFFRSKAEGLSRVEISISLSPSPGRSLSRGINFNTTDHIKDKEPIATEMAQPTGSSPQVTTLMALPKKVKNNTYSTIIIITIGIKYFERVIPLKTLKESSITLQLKKLKIYKKTREPGKLWESGAVHCCTAW